jgi:type I restriction enzyme R subunit
VDEAIEIPKKMGFDNRGTFEIYQHIKNEIEDFNEELVREFAEELTRRIKSRIYIGWQEVTQEYNRMKAQIELLAVNDKYESLNLNIDGPLGDTLMDSILKNFSLN